MARKTPNSKTVNLLYARSGNQCSYPDCDHPIFNDDGLYIAQLCHINAANEGGERFDPEQDDEERRSYENLLFMCHRHHKETDDEENFTVGVLTEIKNTHEAKFTEEGRKASDAMIRQILFEANYYWNRLSKKEFEFAELKLERDFEKEIFALFDELEEHLESISNYCDICADSDNNKILRSDLKSLLEEAKLDYSNISKVSIENNPFIGRNWELHNLARPNYFSHISLCLSELKIKTTEELLKLNPESEKLNELIEKFRTDFEIEYENIYLVD